MKGLRLEDLLARAPFYGKMVTSLEADAGSRLKDGLVTDKLARNAR